MHTAYGETAQQWVEAGRPSGLSEEKREPPSDIENEVVDGLRVDSLKVLDPERPIGETDMVDEYSKRRD